MQIQLSDVAKRFGDHIVFDGLTKRFENNEIHIISGPSGCGKTTLLKLLMELEKTDSGRIILPESARFSVLFQEDRLFTRLTAAANIRLFANCDPSDALKELGLDGWQEKPCSALSGGMQRRVALARAMLTPSDIVLLDEPFRGLDEAARALSKAFILKHRNDRTLFITAHNAEALRFSSTKNDLP